MDCARFKGNANIYKTFGSCLLLKLKNVVFLYMDDLFDCTFGHIAMSIMYNSLNLFIYLATVNK